MTFKTTFTRNFHQKSTKNQHHQILPIHPIFLILPILPTLQSSEHPSIQSSKLGTSGMRGAFESAVIRLTDVQGVWNCSTNLFGSRLSFACKPCALRRLSSKTNIVKDFSWFFVSSRLQIWFCGLQNRSCCLIFRFLSLPWPVLTSFLVSLNFSIPILADLLDFSSSKTFPE